MAQKVYSNRELSAFCLQISILLKAAIPLDEGLAIMAEDAVTEDEKKMLQTLSEDVELGDPFYMALQRTERFPVYVVRMARLGQESGTLDRLMESLSAYYEKQHFLTNNIRNAITYPIMMVVMLLVILFVLFTKVMPIFEDVYSQLGVEMSPLSLTATRLGGILSGAALVLFAVIAVVILLAALAAGMGKAFPFMERLLEWFKGRSKTAFALAGCRFTSVLMLTLQSGMELEKGMEIAADMVDNQKAADRIHTCAQNLQSGMGYYEAMKDTGLFSRFHIQMIKVGARSGRMEEVMRDIAEDYEQQVDTSIDNMVAHLEPTLVVVLAVAVGLILLAVMLPLAGVIASVG